MNFENKLIGQLGPNGSPPLLQNNNIFMSSKVLNLKTLIQDEQTIEADCKRQAKTVCSCK